MPIVPSPVLIIFLLFLLQYPVNGTCAARLQQPPAKTSTRPRRSSAATCHSAKQLRCTVPPGATATSAPTAVHYLSKPRTAAGPLPGVATTTAAATSAHGTATTTTDDNATSTLLAARCCSAAPHNGPATTAATDSPSAG